jgi:hypothetical protein
VNELIRTLRDARDLVEALLRLVEEPPQWLADDAAREIVAIDDLLARIQPTR